MKAKEEKQVKEEVKTEIEPLFQVGALIAAKRFPENDEWILGNVLRHLPYEDKYEVEDVEAEEDERGNLVPKKLILCNFVGNTFFIQSS